MSQQPTYDRCPLHYHVQRMERIEGINPARIVWCCTDQGITPDDLAAECNIAPAIMTRVMNGEDGLTFNQLSNVADYFGRGVLFFLEEGPADPNRVHSPQFRTLANQKPELSPKLRALIERVEQHRDVYRALRDELGEAGYPRFDPPEVEGHTVVQAAAAARAWLGLTEQNTFNTYRHALEARGVLVFRSNGYNGKWQIAKQSPICGFSIYDRECPVIVVKKLEAESRQSFTLMHELGHILLQRSSSIDDESDLESQQGAEQRANAFAGNLLVPDAFLKRINDTARPVTVEDLDDWLTIYRRAWGVSGEVILRRLLDTKRLSQQVYDAYRAWRKSIPVTNDDGGSRVYRYREPQHIFGDRYVRTVLQSLAARNITLTRASKFLDGLKIADLHRLESLYEGS